jgi:large subunit ribosomal protein L33
MAAKSKNKIKVILRSSDPASSYFYTTTKSKKNKEKIRLNKYDPVVNKHVEFVEEKMR